MKLNRLPAVLTVLFVYIGLFLIFLSGSHFSVYHGPMARQGVIDLNRWNFERNGTVQLNGKWSFYPNQLLSPNAIRAGAGKNAQLVTVPDNGQSVDNRKMYAMKAGTYRLLIRSARDRESFGLQTSVIYSANRIFMNGELVGSSGIPSMDGDKQASLRPSVSYFSIHRGINELIIQVSHSEGNSGWGIAKPITFGTQQQISRNHDLTLFNDLFMIVSFFIMGLYFLGYFIQRRKDLHLLFFSIICLIFSMIISWLGTARIIYLIFPDFSFSGMTILESVTSVTACAAVLLYLLFVYPELASKKIVYGGIVLSLVTLITDFIPFVLLTSIDLVLHLFLAVSALAYTSYIFVLAIIKKVEGSIYLTIGTLSISIFVIITAVSAFSAKVLAPVYSISSILFLLMLSLMMSQRSSNAFKRSESLAEELVRNDRQKDEFIARTSHEFRTPLNGIINIAQTILAGKKERSISDERDNLYLITRIGYRLSALVNDVLDMEKIKQGKLTVTPVPLDVYTMVNTELAYYRLLAEKKGLGVINQIPEGLPLVFADENRFRQIINNLVDNAIKYTQKGQITFSAKLLDRDIEIMVADTGSGIPASDQESIFQAFERRDELNQSEGAGLGLSIVKQLVELQKGKIWVQSETGLGSIFHFTVPLFDESRVLATGSSVRIPSSFPVPELMEEQTAAALATPYRSRTVDAPTILVVDDNLDNLKILIDMLEGIPYNVIAVKSGREALDVVSHSQLDLVILDLMMPGMSGYEVCGKIREQYSLTDLPVLMLTAAIINDDKHFAFRAGANDILEKPYNFSELSARIRGLILMKKAASQAANMEVAFLQSQIRPHFLYNVLNSIIALSYDDIEQSREMTAQFAAYLRGSFDFQNTSAISSFGKELSLVKSYLAIEKMRFQERIQVVYDIEEGLDFPLPPLMIQPLVENAVLHGIGKRKSGGRVTLAARREHNFYLISVSDNGIGMSANQVSDLLAGKNGRSVGLKNINSRLKHFYGTELQIESTEGTGTTFSMRVPAE